MTARRRKRSPTLAPLKPSLLFYLWILTHTLTATKRTIYSQTVQVGLGAGTGSSSPNPSSSSSYAASSVLNVGVTVVPAAEAKQNIPSSKSPSFLGQLFSYTSPNYDDLPPWNPSPHIDHKGFLLKTYKCVPGSWEKEAKIGGKYGHLSKHTQKLAAEEQEVYIRQVPGDGNCLFHSLAAGLSWVEDGVHLDFDENSRPPPKSGNARHTKGFLGRGRSSPQSAVGLNPGGSRSHNGDDMGGDWFGRRDRQHGGSGDAFANNRNGRMDIFARSAILRQRSVDMLQPSPPLKSRKLHGCEESKSPSLSSESPRRSTNRSMHQRNDRTYSTTGRKMNTEDHALYLQGSEKLKPAELLQVACSQYGMSGEEYCKQMKNDGVWGGGPEIVSLSNYLKRPIHVYELISVRPTPKQSKPPPNPYKRGKWAQELEDIDTNLRKKEPEFRLRRMACFGSPKFDDREPLHILSADCRFPDLEPGLQATAGNHFMAVFPEPRHRRHRHGSRRRGDNKSPVISLQSNVRVRSGGSDSNLMKGARARKAFTKMNTRTCSSSRNLSSSCRDETGQINDDNKLLTRMINFCTRCTEWRDETAIAAATSTTEILSKNCGSDPLQAFKKWYNTRQE